MKSFFPCYRSFSSDKSIWNEVYFHDQYNLPALSPSDVVVDVGAHTGAFTCACLARGARRIVAFEPDPESFALAMLNIQDFIDRFEIAAPVKVHNSAIWRSDREEPLRITHTRFAEFYRSYYQAVQATLFSDKDTMPVHSVGLDNILGPLAKVSLLNLDCEGAEWPILFTSTLLRRVKRLMLEVHSIPWKAYELGRSVPADLFSEFGHYTFEDLKTRLREYDLVCIGEKINWNCLNNPDFYFGQAVFERREMSAQYPSSLIGRLKWFEGSNVEIAIKASGRSADTVREPITNRDRVDPSLRNTARP